MTERTRTAIIKRDSSIFFAFTFFLFCMGIL
jgi:hypothetical protein